MQNLTKSEQYGAMAMGAFLNWYKSNEEGDLVTAKVHRQEALYFDELSKGQQND